MIGLLSPVSFILSSILSLFQHSNIPAFFCFLTTDHLAGKSLFLFFPRRTDYGIKHAEKEEDHEEQGKAQ